MKNLSRQKFSPCLSLFLTSVFFTFTNPYIAKAQGKSTQPDSRQESNLNTKARFEDEMRSVFRSIVGCPQSGICSKQMTQDMIENWLLNSPDRDVGRQGNRMLNFADFAAFKKRFGNSLAQYAEARGYAGMKFDEPARSFVYNDTGDDLIVVENNNGTNGVKYGPDFRTESTINDFAEDWYNIISKDGPITEDTFVKFMKRAKFLPDVIYDEYRKLISK